jgi:hypothetical protein
MRLNLKVSFAEKDEAKKLGARWDAAQKVWYVESKADMAPFAKWSPTPQPGPAAVEPAATSAPARKLEVAGKLVVGENYVAQARVCACLPWDVCDKCRSMALVS